MEVDPPSGASEEESVLDPCPYLIDFAEYRRSDISEEAAEFWDSLDDANKEEFLTVSASELAKFSCEVVEDPWLVDFLSDVITFFELYGTWEMYVCPEPKCLRLFQDDQSLIIHLKCEHLPEIHPVPWPPRRHNLAEERRCAGALRKMVWKPIVVEPALDMLSSMCLNYQDVTMADVCSGSDRLYSLDWLYSEDPKRKSLLVMLKKKFQILLDEHERASFSLLSDGFLTTMMALASKSIFVSHPPRYNTQFLQELLARSPLSLCLLEAADLDRLLELVETMCPFVQQATLPPANRESEFGEGDVSWNKSEILDILSFSPNESLFVFPKAAPLCNGERVSILSLLCREPCIPLFPRDLSKANESFSCVQKVLNELRECQTTAGSTTTYQISSAQRWHALVQAWCSVYRPKHQSLVALDNPCDSLLSYMMEHFNPSCTSHPLFDPYLFFSFGDSLKDNFIEESHFQSEQSHLQIVNRVLFLEFQLRELSALDGRMYIIPLMKSFLRLKLYCYLSCRRLKMREEDPAAQLSRIPYQEECTEQQCSSEESESDYDSDMDDKPWRDNPTLCILDSTLSESATGEAEGSGPFFWVAISDLLRHCEKDCRGADERVRDGIRRFRLNKTWKYWLCYHCDSMFIDRESHMLHLENEHQLSIGHNVYWLIPKQDSRDEGEEFKQDVVKRESGLEDSITLDHTYDYFLVDSTKFYEIPSANEEELLGWAKHRQYREIVHDLQNQVSHLTRLFEIKCQNLTYLEVVNALGLMLFNGGQPLSLLVSWLHKLSIVDWGIGTTRKLQFQFLSQLLNKAYYQGYGPLSNYSVLEAFKDMKCDLISELSSLNEEILITVDQIDDMKHCLSDHCVCDYRTKIVPSVRSFLHAEFKFDNCLRSLECNNVKELLSSFDQCNVQRVIDSFQLVVLSPGKVIINTMKKSSWAFAFIGIHMSFTGQWSITGSRVELTGGFKYGVWLNRGVGTYGRYGRVTSENCAVMASSIGLMLDCLLCDAVSDKLVFLLRMYGEQIRHHGVGASAN